MIGRAEVRSSPALTPAKGAPDHPDRQSEPGMKARAITAMPVKA